MTDLGLSLNLDLGSPQVKKRTAFTPLSLFASAQNGAWYDPSDLSTLFQDIAGTTPVTTDSQPVGKMLDKSGNNHHLVALSTSARPTFRDFGSGRYLSGDGVDDIMRVDFSLAQPWTRVLAIAVPTWVFGARIASGGSTQNAGSLLHSDVTPKIALFDSSLTAGVALPSLGQSVLTTEVHNGASSSLQINNNAAVVMTTGAAVDPAGQTLFAASNNSAFGRANFWGGIVRAGSFTTAELFNIKVYLQAKSGAVI